MKPSNWLAAVLVAVIGAISAFSVNAAGLTLADRFDTVGQRVAIGGFDPVAYFPEGGGKPSQGFVQRDYTYPGITYRFATDANRAAFQANPARYLPEFNGWCAWAMANLNARVDVEPTSHLIKDGKLYLFYSHPELDTRAEFQKDVPGQIAKANANWEKMAK